VSHANPKPLSSTRSPALSGRIRVPGDKSISHRALMFGAIATRRTTITGLLEAEDVLNTAKALQALGCPIRKTAGTWEVLGRGVGGLAEPDGELDFGNSGTGTRLMMGLIAGHDMTVRMVGDASLSKRPMARVLDPLKRMGAEVLEGATGLPLSLRDAGGWW
jgi:3-phosphoshikimate 1-carboxyvinyltransferase